MAGPGDVAFNGEKMTIESGESCIAGSAAVGVLGPCMHAYIYSERRQKKIGRYPALNFCDICRSN